MKRLITQTPEKAIKFYQEQMVASEASFVENAYEAGLILIAQKKKLSHGEFSDWCSNHWHRTQRTATEYMNLATFLDRETVLGCRSIADAKKRITFKSEATSDLKQDSPVNSTILTTKASSPPSTPVEQSTPIQNGVSDGGDVYEDVPDDEPVKPAKPEPTAKEQISKLKSATLQYYKVAMRSADDLNSLKRNKHAIDEIAEMNVRIQELIKECW